MVQTRRIPVKQSADEITVTVRELITDGVIHQEIMSVLRDHFARKELWIIKHRDGDWRIMRQSLVGINKGQVFTSPSLSACVDFALKWEAPHD